MKKLISNKSLRISMGKKGRKIIKKKFSNLKASRDLIDLYKNGSLS